MVQQTEWRGQPLMVYFYDQLNNEDFEIRLLKIEPSSNADDPIHIVLGHVCLALKPEYKALSYTWARPAAHLPDAWDDPESTKRVMINGKPLEVRYNLFSALQTIRRTWYPDILWWIDALCIDQSNIPERNRQVANMQDIYASSTGTLVWLGPPDDLTFLAFSKIASLSESWNRRPQHLRMPRIRNNDLGEYTDILRSEFAEDSAPSWHALQSLHSRSWFGRAWVVQEICVAPATLVQCGDRMVTWIDLLNTRQVIVQHCGSIEKATVFESAAVKQVLSALLATSLPWQNLTEIMFRYRINPPSIVGSDLVTVLNQLRSKLATEPRDKVYAGLGLAGNDGPAIVIDYNLPIEVIYAQVARKSIERSQSFHSLAYCHYPPKLPGLPTWAADWSDTSVTHWIALPQKGFHYFESPNQEQLYHTTEASGLDVRFEAGGLRMVLSAGILGQLAFTSSSGMRKYDNAGQAPRERLDIETIAEYVEGSKESAMDYNAITLKAKWLREWAVSQLGAETSSFPMIHRTDWLFDSAIGNDTFKKPLYKPTNEDLLEAYLRTLAADFMLDQRKGHDVRVPSTKEYTTQAKNQEFSLAEVLSMRLEGRALAMTESGFLSLVPAEARVDDLIALVSGSELPLILRPSQDGFSFIGQAYVHGIMDGEVWSLVEDGSIPLKEISIT
ncbi:MAG: hypothetical protein L6R39_005221 [Caloplaca ligustica]|nr:MAG: hypothetical protein L6R39_005221 [Caloplaca ligustica]